MTCKKYYVATCLAIALAYPSFEANALFKPSPERMLSKMDRDKNGSVSKSEMFAVIANNKEGKQQAEAEMLFLCLDTNKDETLSLTELSLMSDVRQSIKNNGTCWK